MVIDQLHCPMSYAVYKFQPEVMQFSACCDARTYEFDRDLFDALGDDYFEKHPKLVKRKEDLYKNIRNSDCEQCWMKEDEGLRSMRQQYSHEWKMINTRRDLKVDLAYPGRIELWMNSTCNLGCFMCHLGNSNTLRKIWHKDYDHFGNDGVGWENWTGDMHGSAPGYRKRFEESMLKFVIKALNECPNKELVISYLGGEPTLHSEMYDHADLFIEAGKAALERGCVLKIEITTNGTSKDRLNERFYRMFEKYKSAGWVTRIMLSQDAANEQAQVRWGADFPQIRRNFGNWIHPDSSIDHVTTFTVVSALNLPYMDDMADYIHGEIVNNYDGKKNLTLNFNTLIMPKWMRVRHLPRRFAIEAAAHATTLYGEIVERWPHVNYQEVLFKNIVSTLKERPAEEDMQFFFEALDYTNRVYQKQDANWDFYKQFPHLNEVKAMYRGDQ